MTDKAKRIASPAEALTVFQVRCGTVDEHALADLICDLGTWLKSATSIFSVKLGGILGTSTLNIMLLTAIISA